MPDATRIPTLDQLALELAHHPALAVLLDFDGTLVDYAPTPEAVELPPSTIELLRELAASVSHVYVVSGRSRDALARPAAMVPEVTWLAEHGASRRERDGTWAGPDHTRELDEVVAKLASLASVPGVRIEHKAVACCLHWRLVPVALKPALIAAAELIADEWLEGHPEFERVDGIQLLEVRRTSANKGLAVERIRAADRGARIIAIGDDETDEDMFAGLRADELAIGIGGERVRVRCSLDSYRDVHAFLRWLLDARHGGSPMPFLSAHGRLPPRSSVRARLVVLTNRTPPKSQGRHRSVGGLVSALEPALQEHDGIWLGWSGAESHGEPRVVIDDTTRPLHASFDLPPAWRERYYAGFCNRGLWPLFHGFLDRARFRDEDWEAYVAANALFAAHAEDHVEGDGMVWVHDYHLLLAGRALRARGFRGSIGMFLHIPFPQRDTFAVLPWGRELIQAMADFDLVGFHTEQWANNFRECARGYELDTPRLCVLPIGVDPRAFAAREDTPDREVAGLRSILGSRLLILGVDRLDYAKGIPERLLAFERLLELHVEWRGKVVFVQVSVPSREDVPEYTELRQRVETLVGRINGRFGEADWVPVRYLYRSYDHAVLAELYRAAEVALVTPLRDGLNLVAKEFVLAQDPAAPGVLVLSRFAGAAAELSSALLTNPFHIDGLAADLDRALRMPPTERVARHARLLTRLEGRTPQRWATTFLEGLTRAERSVA